MNPILSVYCQFLKMQFESASRSIISNQKKTLSKIVKKAQNTQFGRRHRFEIIKDYNDYKSQVPIHNYEDLKPWINKIISGERDVLWPGKPKYMVTTSGTISGSKLIPITEAHLRMYLKSGRLPLMLYLSESQEFSIFKGKNIYFQGSPELESKNLILCGRLSGVVAHHLPSFLTRNRIPSWKTNCIPDFEEKMSKIVDEAHGQDLRIIAGVPPWVLMFLRMSSQRFNKTIEELFPHLQIYIQGGASFDPYKETFNEYLGNKVIRLETYASSEGFHGFRYRPDEEDFFFNPFGGIFYEFVPLSDWKRGERNRIPLWEVQLNCDYVVILSSFSGLWSYCLEDVISFSELEPFRFKLKGRVGQSLSVFGEHVTEFEVENALRNSLNSLNSSMIEYRVCSNIPKNSKPNYFWEIEFEKTPVDLNEFVRQLDKELSDQNPYYKDLLAGEVIQGSKLRSLGRGQFYKELIDKNIDGQSKVLHIGKPMRES